MASLFDHNVCAFCFQTDLSASEIEGKREWILQNITFNFYYRLMMQMMIKLLIQSLDIGFHKFIAYQSYQQDVR